MKHFSVRDVLFLESQNEFSQQLVVKRESGIRAGGLGKRPVRVRIMESLGAKSCKLRLLRVCGWVGDAPCDYLWPPPTRRLGNQIFCIACCHQILIPPQTYTGLLALLKTKSITLYGSASLALRAHKLFNCFSSLHPKYSTQRKQFFVVIHFFAARA